MNEDRHSAGKDPGGHDTLRQYPGDARTAGMSLCVKHNGGAGLPDRHLGYSEMQENLGSSSCSMLSS